MSSKETILFVDDDLAMRRTLRGLLESRAYEVLDAATGEAALEILQSASVDLVVTDLRMPGMTGGALVAEMTSTFPAIPVIAITAFGSVQDAIGLTRAGAADYLEKPFRTKQFMDSVERALRESSALREQLRLSRADTTSYRGLLGASAAMHELFARMERVGPSPAAVLITGESGTGKELVARAVHEASGREPFLAINCGAIPQSILESELFGHAKGAFTGAIADRAGLFEAASGGTLFLDEIGELPLHLQPKLLRALESGEIRRVGEVRTRKVALRIVAATNRDLTTAVEEGEFREDLYWRLGVLHLELPPLRDRPGDVPLLVDAFVREIAGTMRRRLPHITSAALTALSEYHWPGNVRQLRNTLEAMLTFGSGQEITIQDVPAEIRRALADRDVIRPAVDRELTLAELERDYIFEVLRRTGGNKSQAAGILGIPRRTLYRRLDSYASDTPAVHHDEEP